MSSKLQIYRETVFYWQNSGHITTEDDFRSLSMLLKIETNLEKVRPTFFKSIQMQSVLQFCPSMVLVGLSVFLFSSYTVLSSYSDHSVNLMTKWSVIKLSKVG